MSANNEVVDLTKGTEKTHTPVQGGAAKAPSMGAVPSRRASAYSAAGAYYQGSSSEPVVVTFAKSKTVVSFSLVSLRDFTVRIDQGAVNREILGTLKQFQGDFDFENRRWVFPTAQYQMLLGALVSTHKVDVIPLPPNALAAVQVRDRSGNQNFLKNQIHKRLAKALAGFQKRGVEFIVKCDGRALLADEMGLGKTIQAIACAAYYRKDWPVLIITPSTARLNWQSEVLMWLCPDVIAPNDVTLVEGTNHQLSKSHKIVIMSYSLLDKMADKLKRRNFNVIIADESHYLKNSKARRTKALVPLLQKSRRAILLSGTPALSRPKELFTQLNALNKRMWHDEREFLLRYCRSKTGSSSGAFSEFNGASNTAELHACLCGTVMLRRLKSDILSMLPSKERRVVQIPIVDQEKEVHLRELLATISKTEDERKAAVRERKKRRLEGARNVAQDTAENGSSNVMSSSSSSASSSSPLSSSSSSMVTGTCNTYQAAEMRKVKKSLLMQLFKDSGVAKLPSLCAKLGAFLDDKTTGKVLVFAHHRAVLDGLSMFLSRRGTECIRIDGQTQPRDRFARVKHFQTSSVCRVALLAITAAGVSITLTAASTVYFAELFWTPGSLIQAEDRAHRIGQSATVNVNYLLSPGTIDEILWPMIHKKMKLLGEVVEGHSKSENGDALINGSETSGEANTTFFPGQFILKQPQAQPQSQGTPSSAATGTSTDDSSSPATTVEDSEVSNKLPGPFDSSGAVGSPSVKHSTSSSDFNQLESLIEELASQDARTKKTVDDDEEHEDDDEETPWGQGERIPETDHLNQPDKLAMLHMQLTGVDGGDLPHIKENDPSDIPGYSASPYYASSSSSPRSNSRKATKRDVQAAHDARVEEENAALEMKLDVNKDKLGKFMASLTKNSA